MIRSLIRRRTLNCAGIHNTALGMTAGKIIQIINNPLFDETAFCSRGCSFMECRARQWSACQLIADVQQKAQGGQAALRF